MVENVFVTVTYTVQMLLDNIELGDIGLPDIQRPFVWNNSKVRDLFDSMYRGYPVGFLLFWQNGIRDDSRRIGIDVRAAPPPRLLIVDGQQRLTSLYAVVKNRAVVRENYATEQIKIAFNPLDEKFEVTDAAILRDSSYVPDISVLWAKDASLLGILSDYLANLQSVRDITPAEKRRIELAMEKLRNLLGYSFEALQLAATVDEEQVAEVFVRVNSKGTPLNQADFILTLMSVFWDAGRADLEAFCRGSRDPKSPEYNHYCQPDPDQLLRVGVGLGFRRARLEHVYSILRGKDLATGQFSVERRDEQFRVLKEAQAKVLDLRHWHDFLLAIRQAGVRSSGMISSQSNLLYSYVFYLLGRTEYAVDEFALRKAIARWYFMGSLTGRYSGSPESAMDFDLARLRNVSDGQSFLRVLGQVCDQALTDDYWNITLPGELATASSRGPSLFAYHAALVMLDARALYSEQKVADLLDPAIKVSQAGLARHHLFPRGYLDKVLHITDNREVNQIANFAFAEWRDNLDISDKAPSMYAPEFEKRFKADELERMYYWHALPGDWQALTYEEFLVQRRELIAKVIRDAYQRLCRGPRDRAELERFDLPTVVTGGETDFVEFKSTLRVNLHTGKPDERIELSCLKTIGGFLNADGGSLVIGLTDDGRPVGIDKDQFPNEDKLSLHLVNLLKDRIGAEFMMYIHPRFEDYDGSRVLVVACKPSRSAVYVKDGATERFYVRTGPSTSELSPREVVAYVKSHFR